jgi:hypothetical protein
MSLDKSIIISAFRAIDNAVLCQEFIRGHRKVLASYNIPKITSDDNLWAKNEDVYVIIVRALGGEIVGGARIHVKNESFMLPIEEAFSEKHTDFYQWMKQFQNTRIGEMCGLWNAKIIAGSGISLLLTRSIMAKSGIVIANQLKLNSLLCLCAPWTVNLVKEFGFDIAENIGNKGAYPYPRPDLLATVMFIKDTEELHHASSVQRQKVFDLRYAPIQKAKEQRNEVQLEVNYNLVIHNLNTFET